MHVDVDGRIVGIDICDFFPDGLESSPVSEEDPAVAEQFHPRVHSQSEVQLIPVPPFLS